MKDYFMKKINEVIIVEGKNDRNKLNSIIDADIIITNGSHLSKKTLELIELTNNKRGVIIFTDPDNVGEKIRAIINEKVKGCKNAFLAKDKAIGNRKIGIEHALKEDILLALEKLVTYSDTKETITMIDCYELGLMGQPNSSTLRKLISNHYNIGDVNAKLLCKRLNYLKITIDDIKELL